MILGIIGGIFGIIAGLAEGLVGGIGEAFHVTAATNLYVLAVLAIVASIIGIVGAALVGGRAKVGGALMVIAAVLGIIAASYFFILPGILLGIAGILALVRKVEPPAQSTKPAVSGTFCSNCGAPLAANVKFCGKCGSVVA
jgi:hypothetical protein